MRTQMVFGALAVLAALATPANAVEAVPDPGTQREFGAKLLVCDACHEAGRSKNAAIPIISGQQENYLAKQLHDFRSGDRNFEIMTWMANTLTPEELAPAAARVAKKNWPARPAGAASTPAPRGIAVCQACHAQNYLGAPQAEGMTTPRLAGQSYEYLVEAMRKFAEGERTNNGDMVQIMKAISSADREAMARYLSSL
ncbi:MAG TPA: c-type cytochrome [Micropepsaceae bacterium]|nr:c-type cytochrome [Micropepsaceae bacterium]